MNIRDISDLAYILKNLNKPENKNLPKPIVFLGAGCSVTAGIPQAKDIVNEIIKEYSDKPSVKRLEESDKKNYYQLMSALSANERREIFQKYVNSENVKINLAHIYLAQLLHEGYIDYVFTPNFDDLLLKACSLFNFIPPVYDIANINDFTTTSFQKQSVTYLHGQHHGQWLLNAKGELEKVKPNLSSLFQRVCNQRPWIIIGYSGEDEIFDELQKFSSFDDELYWIGYKNNEPSKKVKDKLLDIEHKNTFIIQGYDADSFFLNLHSSLNLETPLILNKPFSFVKKMVNHIQNIDVENSTEENKEIYKAVKERYDDCNNMIDEAIDKIENTKDNVLKQEMMEAVLKKDYTNIEKYLKIVTENNDVEEKEILSLLYHNFGNSLNLKGRKEKNEALFNDACEKYKISFELNEKDYSCINNWGLALRELAILKNDENIFLKSLEKFKEASNLNPNNADVFENWGLTLDRLALLKKDKNLFLEAFEKYKLAIAIKPDKYSLYVNWGVALGDLAIQKKDENLFIEAIEKHKLAFNLNSKSSMVLVNWGIALTNLGNYRNDENLYLEADEKFKAAYKLDSQNTNLLNMWGNTLSQLAILKKDENLYVEGIEKYKLAFDLNRNDETLYFNWGTSLLNFAQLKQNEKLFIEANEKFQNSNQIYSNNNSSDYNYSSLLDNWCSSHLFLFQINKKPEHIDKALELAKKAFKLNSMKTYNLSCCYARLEDKQKALYFLEKSLDNKITTIKYIIEDPDWENYKNDIDFVNLLKRYEN